MNKTIKGLWTTTLRSGKYPQAPTALHRLSTFEAGRPTGYCCYGVLCELAIQAGVIVRNVPVFGDEFEYYGVHKASSYLPPEVVEWAGLPNVDPIVVDKSLSYYNDIEETDFLGIADLIDENL